MAATYHPNTLLCLIICQELSIEQLRDPLNIQYYRGVSFKQYMDTKYDEKRKVLRIPHTYIVCLDNVVARHCIAILSATASVPKQQLDEFKEISNHLVDQFKTQLWMEVMHKRPFSVPLFTSILGEALHLIYNNTGLPYLMSTVKLGRNIRSINCWTSHPELVPIFTSYHK